jgi:hypothetical protein
LPRSILGRLNSRKIVHWGIAYLAGAWLILQVLDLLAQPFAWPDLVLRAATVVLAIGFFAALVLAWYHGEGRQAGDRHRVDAHWHPRLRARVAFVSGGGRGTDRAPSGRVRAGLDRGTRLPT